jgi:CxxC-x17-CxxC domain-containing protein
MSEDINFFAETSYRNIRKKFGIKLDDRRRHFYVIGKTGMGKTVMIKNMAIQDIQSGKGIGFLDPHGEAAEELLDYIPASRINDVVYINPGDIDYPIAFNIMEEVDVAHRHLVAGGMMGVFKKIWPDVWSARMEYILNNCILALLEYPGATLLGVNRMLSDVEYRKKVIEKVTDPVVKAFWIQEYSRYTQRYEVEATAAIQNKIGQFISAPLIRNIIGQIKSSFDMRNVMDEKKILIMNLSKGRIGEDNSRLLGALMITKLQLAAMSRVDIPEEQRNDFFLYIDEFQNFATESFTNILSEARKYRLALILGHQYITQMDETVRDAVFGNVGTLVSFRVGAEDAEYLEKEFTPEFLASDLVNLAKYNIYLKLMIDGLAGRPFSATTLPPLPKTEKSNVENIIKASRERYSNKRSEVEEKISKWTGVMDQTNISSSVIEAPVLYDARCSLCGKDTKVTFKPDGVRPVYCKPCRKKLEKEKEDNGSQNHLAEKELPKEPEKENIKEKMISLKDAIEKRTISFSKKGNSINGEEKPKTKRKEVNLGELRKVLGESLDGNEKNKEIKDKNEKGVIKPGETIEF